MYFHHLTVFSLSLSSHEGVGLITIMKGSRPSLTLNQNVLVAPVWVLFTHFRFQLFRLAPPPTFLNCSAVDHVWRSIVGDEQTFA